MPSSGSNEVVRLTRNKLIGLAALSAALLAIGAGAFMRFWAPPRLSPPRTPIRATNKSDLSADQGPHDIPCTPTPEQGATAASEPIEASVCGVVQHPDEFACKRIRVRATLLTDCMHGSVLTDERCARGLVPYGSSSPTTDAFFEGACAGPRIDFDSKRRATFTGRFRLRSERGRTIFVLEVESVKDIKITPAGGREGKLSMD